MDRSCRDNNYAVHEVYSADKVIVGCIHCSHFQGIKNSLSLWCKRGKFNIKVANVDCEVDDRCTLSEWILADCTDCPNGHWLKCGSGETLHCEACDNEKIIFRFEEGYEPLEQCPVAKWDPKDEEEV